MRSYCTSNTRRIQHRSFNPYSNTTYCCHRSSAKYQEPKTKRGVAAKRPRHRPHSGVDFLIDALLLSEVVCASPILPREPYSSSLAKQRRLETPHWRGIILIASTARVWGVGGWAPTCYSKTRLGTPPDTASKGRPPEGREKQVRSYPR